jgi:hypothetical protein
MVAERFSRAHTSRLPFHGVTATAGKEVCRLTARAGPAQYPGRWEQYHPHRGREEGRARWRRDGVVTDPSMLTVEAEATRALREARA